MDWLRIEPDIRGKMPTINRLIVVRPHLLKESLTSLSPQHGSFRGRFIAYKAFIRRELCDNTAMTVAWLFKSSH
jgi:hypothetical protein